MHAATWHVRIFAVTLFCTALFGSLGFFAPTIAFASGGNSSCPAITNSSTQEYNSKDKPGTVTKTKNVESTDSDGETLSTPTKYTVTNYYGKDCSETCPAGTTDKTIQASCVGPSNCDAKETCEGKTPQQTTGGGVNAGGDTETTPPTETPAPTTPEITPATPPSTSPESSGAPSSPESTPQTSAPTQPSAPSNTNPTAQSFANQSLLQGTINSLTGANQNSNTFPGLISSYQQGAVSIPSVPGSDQVTADQPLEQTTEGNDTFGPPPSDTNTSQSFPATCGELSCAADALGNAETAVVNTIAGAASTVDGVISPAFSAILAGMDNGAQQLLGGGTELASLTQSGAPATQTDIIPPPEGSAVEPSLFDQTPLANQTDQIVPNFIQNPETGKLEPVIPPEDFSGPTNLESPQTPTQEQLQQQLDDVNTKLAGASAQTMSPSDFNNLITQRATLEGQIAAIGNPPPEPPATPGPSADTIINNVKTSNDAVTGALDKSVETQVDSLAAQARFVGAQEDATAKAVSLGATITPTSNIDPNTGQPITNISFPSQQALDTYNNSDEAKALAQAATNVTTTGTAVQQANADFQSALDTNKAAVDAYNNMDPITKALGGYESLTGDGGTGLQGARLAAYDAGLTPDSAQVKTIDSLQNCLANCPASTAYTLASQILAQPTTPEGTMIRNTVIAAAVQWDQVSNGATPLTQPIANPTGNPGIDFLNSQGQQFAVGESNRLAAAITDIGSTNPSVASQNYINSVVNPNFGQSVSGGLNYVANLPSSIIQNGTLGTVGNYLAAGALVGPAAVSQVAAGIWDSGLNTMSFVTGDTSYQTSAQQQLAFMQGPAAAAQQQFFDVGNTALNATIVGGLATAGVGTVTDGVVSTVGDTVTALQENLQEQISADAYASAGLKNIPALDIDLTAVAPQSALPGLADAGLTRFTTPEVTVGVAPAAVAPEVAPEGVGGILSTIGDSGIARGVGTTVEGAAALVTPTLDTATAFAAAYPTEISESVGAARSLSIPGETTPAVESLGYTETAPVIGTAPTLASDPFAAVTPAAYLAPTALAAGGTSPALSSEAGVTTPVPSTVAPVTSPVPTSPVAGVTPTTVSAPAPVTTTPAPATVAPSTAPAATTPAPTTAPAPSVTPTTPAPVASVVPAGAPSAAGPQLLNTIGNTLGNALTYLNPVTPGFGATLSPGPANLSTAITNLNDAVETMNDAAAIANANTKNETGLNALRDIVSATAQLQQAAAQIAANNAVAQATQASLQRQIADLANKRAAVQSVITQYDGSSMLQGTFWPAVNRMKAELPTTAPALLTSAQNLADSANAAAQQAKTSTQAPVPGYVKPLGVPVIVGVPTGQPFPKVFRPVTPTAPGAPAASVAGQPTNPAGSQIPAAAPTPQTNVAAARSALQSAAQSLNTPAYRASNWLLLRSQALHSSLASATYNVRDQKPITAAQQAALQPFLTGKNTFVNGIIQNKAAAEAEYTNLDRFISYAADDWCAGTVALIMNIVFPNKVPSYVYVDDFYKAYQNAGTLHTVGDGYQPQPMDLFFIKKANSTGVVSPLGTGYTVRNANGVLQPGKSVIASHVGFVLSYNPSTRMVTTIEGNAGGQYTSLQRPLSSIMAIGDTGTFLTKSGVITPSAGVPGAPGVPAPVVAPSNIPGLTPVTAGTKGTATSPVIVDQKNNLTYTVQPGISQSAAAVLGNQARALADGTVAGTIPAGSSMKGFVAKPNGTVTQVAQPRQIIPITSAYGPVGRLAKNPNVPTQSNITPLQFATTMQQAGVNVIDVSGGAGGRGTNMMSTFVWHGDALFGSGLVNYCLQQNRIGGNCTQGVLKEDGTLVLVTPINAKTNQAATLNSNGPGVEIAGAINGRDPTPAQITTMKKMTDVMMNQWGWEVGTHGQLEPGHRGASEAGPTTVNYVYNGGSSVPQPAYNIYDQNGNLVKSGVTLPASTLSDVGPTTLAKNLNTDPAFSSLKGSGTLSVSPDNTIYRVNADGTQTVVGKGVPEAVLKQNQAALDQLKAAGVNVSGIKQLPNGTFVDASGNQVQVRQVATSPSPVFASSILTPGGITFQSAARNTIQMYTASQERQLLSSNPVLKTTISHFTDAQGAYGPINQSQISFSSPNLLPGTVVQVTVNGKTVQGPVVDRGPDIGMLPDRYLDASQGACQALGFCAAGLANATFQIVSVPTDDQIAQYLGGKGQIPANGHVVPPGTAPITPNPGNTAIGQGVTGGGGAGGTGAGGGTGTGTGAGAGATPSYQLVSIAPDGTVMNIGPVIKGAGAAAIAAAGVAAGAAVYVYSTDDKGNPDGEIQKIVSPQSSDGSKEVTLVVDKNGNLVLDKNGNPIPFDPTTVPPGTWSPDGSTYTIPAASVTPPPGNPNNPWRPGGAGNPYGNGSGSPYTGNQPTQIGQPTGQPQPQQPQPPRPLPPQQPPLQQPAQPIQQPLPQPILQPTPPTGTGTGTSTSTPSQIPRPVVTLIANPSSVHYGGTARLSWTSLNTTACEVTEVGAQQIGPTATSGTATTPALTATTIFTATCQSNSAAQVSATTTVQVQ